MIRDTCFPKSPRHQPRLSSIELIVGGGRQIVIMALRLGSLEVDGVEVILQINV